MIEHLLHKGSVFLPTEKEKPKRNKYEKRNKYGNCQQQQRKFGNGS